MVGDIIKAISKTLSQAFGQGYEIYFSQDVQQGLKEPCFIITLVGSSRTKRIAQRYYQANTFAVHYFPSIKGGNTEMMGTAAQLYEALEVIPLLGGESVRGTAMNYSISDGVLYFLVDYNVFLKSEIEFEEMEDLVVDADIAQEG